ncbi:glycosyltransferase [Pontibacter silvestris]|uniref:Glycosyltransferase n=1 Tax=Pontibacter silvestris TaxID=2305183 RepID=A0ABW4WYH5_9BACT|nr:glycosyltransferase [Pontibacter silvestris]MCC9136741.1 glycosyltransferase [Pontibacter silvestris]
MNTGDSKVRLLYLPNEAMLDNRCMQIGPRKAFEHLLETNQIEAYSAFSFLHEYNTTGSYETVRNKLLQEAKKFKPNVILWQHITSFDAPAEFLRELKNIESKPVLAYHEGDPYGRYFKRMSPQLKVILREADIVFMIGLGTFAELAREAGAKKVFYAPHMFDSVRSGKPWTPTTEREHDIVMIANAGKTRIPGRYFPGGRNRMKLAKKLTQRFGRRFALYGKGWDKLESSRGLLPFDKQEETIQSAWLTINWDHFDKVPYYFSNRLPISLAAGVPHITSYHAGYEHMFDSCKGLYAVKTVDEAVETAQFLLSQPKSRLIQEGIQGRDFVFNNLEANIVFTNILNTIKSEHFKPDKAAIENSHFIVS